jgi:hypothetical protein
MFAEEMSCHVSFAVRSSESLALSILWHISVSFCCTQIVFFALGLVANVIVVHI